MFPLEELKAKYASELAASPLRVTLIDSPNDPWALGAGSARTCYSSKGIITPEKVHASEEVSQRVAEATLKSGHLTTRQHANFVFGIDKISRNLIWQVLHSHPYYNSEQVSQRYVALSAKEHWYVLPLSLQKDKHSDQLMQRSLETYQKLVEILKPVVSEIYFGIHRLKARTPEKYAKEIEKKAMEVARYVLPLSTTAYLYHTISALTLYRYAATMLQTGHSEQIVFVLRMIEAIAEKHPELLKEIPSPEPATEQKLLPEEIAKAHKEFDALLHGKTAQVLNPQINKDTLRTAWLSATGTPAPGTASILQSLLTAKENPESASPLYPLTMDAKSRILNVLTFQIGKKISHTADSQAQRHRTIPGTRPLLAHSMSLETEYITPALIHESPEAQKIYNEYMDESFKLIRHLHTNGTNLTDLTYLLPNAFPVRYVESADLMNLFHRFKSRLCYNAQEEIYASTREEALQITQSIPELSGLLAPPCALREGIKPRCPEGNHFCGVKVWNLPLNEQMRIL